MKKLNSKESGLCVIPDKNDKSDMIDDGLHAFVCPNCGNDILVLRFDGKDIVCYEDKQGWHRFSCWGGFGIEEYTWIPHKCTACNTKFLAWTSEKKINGPVIVYYILTIILAAVACVDIACAISIKPEYFLFLMVFAPLIFICLSGIEEETLNKTDNPMKEIIEEASFLTDEEEDPEEAVISKITLPSGDTYRIPDGYGTMAKF